jgi:hypothetical protein
MIARKRWAPIRKHSNKLTTRQVGFHVTFRQVGQAESLQGSLEQSAGAVENQLTLHAHVSRSGRRKLGSAGIAERMAGASAS